MVLYSNNSISFQISTYENSSIDSTILPEKLKISLDKGFVSNNTDNRVITRLFDINCVWIFSKNGKEVSHLIS